MASNSRFGAKYGNESGARAQLAVGAVLREPSWLRRAAPTAPCAAIIPSKNNSLGAMILPASSSGALGNPTHQKKYSG
jgi:hypothetical protein